MPLTVSDPKGGTGVDGIVLELIVGKPKYSYKELQEDPDTEEDTFASLIDHPMLPSLTQSRGFHGEVCRLIKIGPHKTLESLAFCLVALQVGRSAIRFDINVRVINHGSSICKVKTRRAITSHASWDEGWELEKRPALKEW